MQILADYPLWVTVGLLLGVLLCASSCANTCRPVKYAEPARPCTEIIDLLKDPAERLSWDPLNDADRETCLIEWVKRYREMTIWER